MAVSEILVNRVMTESVAHAVRFVLICDQILHETLRAVDPLNTAFRQIDRFKQVKVTQHRIVR